MVAVVIVVAVVVWAIVVMRVIKVKVSAKQSLAPGVKVVLLTSFLSSPPRYKSVLPSESVPVWIVCLLSRQVTRKKSRQTGLCSGIPVWKETEPCGIESLLYYHS